jgi:KGK domain
MPNDFKTLDGDLQDSDSVISFHQSMFKILEFMQAVKEAFQYKGLDELGSKLSHRGGIPLWKENRHLWFKDGVETEILRLNSKGWQKGKVRIKVTLEFCPDEPEIEETSEIIEPKSPLDDLRRMIDE